MKNNIDIIFIKYGIISAVSQIIFIRELMVIFGGNELSIGITLCSWLLGTAAGSFVFSKIFTSGKNINLTVSSIFIILSVTIPVTLLFIRSVKNILNIQTGELIDIFSISGLSLLFLFPFCFLLGSLFLFASFLSVHTFHNLLPKHFLYGLAFVLFSLSLHYFPQFLFVNRFTVLIGKLSFSMYLVHFMVLNLMKIVILFGGK